MSSHLVFNVTRPLIIIAGGYDQDQVGMGGFQEWNQVCCSEPHIH